MEVEVDDKIGTYPLAIIFCLQHLDFKKFFFGVKRLSVHHAELGFQLRGVQGINKNKKNLIVI